MRFESEKTDSTVEVDKAHSFNAAFVSTLLLRRHPSLRMFSVVPGDPLPRLLLLLTKLLGRCSKPPG